MKKSFLFIAMMLLSTTFLTAQEFVNFGAKGGLNFASFSGSDADDLDFQGRTGYHLGLVMEIPLASEFSVQPEVLYSTVGGQTNQLVVDKATDAEFSLDYISVPVMFKYYILGGLNVEAGPQFSFNTRNDIGGDFNEDDVLQEFDAITNEDPRSFDFGGAVGLGYNLPLGLFAQARYVFGLSDVYQNFGVRNDLVQLSIGMKF